MLSCILYTVYALESGYLGESMGEEGTFIKYKCLKKPCALLILLQTFCSWLNATDRQLESKLLPISIYKSLTYNKKKKAIIRKSFMSDLSTKFASRRL